ncbi:hypothetical protein [Georgenia thermotolerans]|uniref:Uncharacterized protein n=1 Tax=Georgenia thermotolerans TaxID=527326 RepID=A0A7J5ULN5_9MICO|nr:hypothetical protein [Georgenia thermotolerans]KAE8762803.1 hypothetical protein GB883_17475 [Georgenia thermotolerans]
MGIDAIVRTVRRVARRLRGRPAAPPVEPVARLRAEVRRSLERTGRAVGAAESRGSLAGGLASEAAYLARVGAELDDDLALAQREPDPRVRDLWADWLADRVVEHRRLCADLRRQAHRTAAWTGGSRLLLASDQQAFLEAGIRMRPNRPQV